MKKQIHITKADQIKLAAMMEGMKTADERQQRWLMLLEHELDRANIVESHEIPLGTVTLHSRVRLLDLDSSESVVYRLVLPSEANSADGSLSILAPIGIALLGYGEGDRFECETPGGIRRFLVESVLFQPEADVLRRRLLGCPRHETEKVVSARIRTENACELSHSSTSRKATRSESRHGRHDQSILRCADPGALSSSKQCGHSHVDRFGQLERSVDREPCTRPNETTIHRVMRLPVLFSETH